MIQIPIKHWSHDAACKNADTEIFFSTRQMKPTETAKAYCRNCPVSIECLEEAMKAETMLYGNRYGIFGGMLPKERERLQKQRIKNNAH